MNVRNELPEATTLHWHGMRLPAAADGGPHLMVAPGESWQPSWTVDQPAATFWYHRRPHGATERHVYKGLGGLLPLNAHNQPHNSVIHNVQFQILAVDYAPPPPELGGWKDTVYVPPGVTIRLLMKWGGHSDPVIPYMYHCHLLWHGGPVRGCLSGSTRGPESRCSA